MLSVGIDIGTTNICAITLDSGSGRIIDIVNEPNNSFMVSSNKFEKIQNPKVIYQKIQLIINNILESNLHIGCIGITGQMHGILYIDKNGEAASPLYTWQDKRGDEIFRENQSYAARLSELTGFKAASGCGLVTHYYNLLNGIVPKKAVSFCTIHDYIAMKLANNKFVIVHPSSAASFSCYNLLENNFEVKNEIKNDLLPRIETSKTIIGETKEKIPVAIAVGDNQASFLGSVRNPNKSVLVNVGTGSQISVLTGDYIEFRKTETRPYVDDKFLLVGAALCGGGAYQVLKNFFEDVIFSSTGQRAENLYGLMDNAALKALEKDSGLNIVTQFSGTRYNPDARGYITGISTDNMTFGNFSLGVLNGIVSELYEEYEEIKSLCNLKYLIGSGNGIRKSPLLQRLFMEKFDISLDVPVHEEEASFGAALFALTAAGEFKSFEDAQKLIKYK